MNKYVFCMVILRFNKQAEILNCQIVMFCGRYLIISLMRLEYNVACVRQF